MKNTNYLASWDFEVIDDKDDFIEYQGISHPKNKMKNYKLFPGLMLMYIDLREKYQVKASDSKGRKGYRISYCYEGNYFTYINDTKILITREIFIGKALPYARESYTTKDRIQAFNFLIFENQIDKDSFYGKILEEFLKKINSIKDMGFVYKNERLIQRANELIQVLKSEDVLGISIKALDLIYDITREKTSEIRKSYQKEEKSEEIVLIEEFIKENLDKEITLDLLTKKFKISKSNLNNKFIRKFQYTPIKYLNNLRMMKAEEILMKTDKNITEISMELGLTSPSNFTRSFKKFTGLSPSEYRKKEALKEWASF